MLARITTERPNLLVLDGAILDDVSGWQLLQALRMHRSTHALPIIVCADQGPQLTELAPHLVRIGVAVVLSTDTGEALLSEIQRQWPPHPLPRDDGLRAVSP